MRYVRASKYHLGVAVCAAVLGGGCRANSGTTSAVAPAMSVATADVPPAELAAPAAADEVSQSDVIGWTLGGVSDGVIVDRVGHARASAELSAGDELRLRDAGVSDDVIRAMKAAAWN